MSDIDKKKIVKAIQSENFEETIKDEGFSIYTTESNSKKKIRDQL